MNIIKSQDIKLIHRNPWHSYTLTMKQTEKEIKETILFTIAMKRIKYLGMLLSHVSRVRLCETSETAAHQAPPSLGFSRQEHWSGLPFPSPTRESEVAQSCPTLRDPVDCSDSPSIRSLFGTLCYSPRSSVCPGTTPGANAHLKRPVRWPFCLEHSLPK